MQSDDQTAVIIGGGLGGLFTGALLAREGWHVTVLEKNDVAGGGLQCFTRGGVRFETGMHVLGGLQNGGTVDLILKYLGIHDSIVTVNVDPGCMDEVKYGSDGMTYRLPQGREHFTEALSAYFPDEARGISEYVSDLYSIADEVDLFNLRPAPAYVKASSPKLLTAADELIYKHLSDPRLRDLAAYVNPLYGGVAGHTPAYIHALISVLYINGTSRFAGGSQQLADALTGVIAQGGGAVLTRHEVKSIEVTDRHVQSVSTSDGQRFTASRYISAVHPCELLRCLPVNAFPKSYSARLKSIPNSTSSFVLFIKLKPDKVPYINHTCYYQDDYGLAWTHNRMDDEWPRGFMYMTPPDCGQPGMFATKLLVNSLMDFDEVEQWAESRYPERPDGYMTWKKRMIHRVLAKLEHALPGINSGIEAVWAASPLTIRDYYNTERGSIYGYRKDCRNIMLSQLPVVTKIDNLLLTGQNNNLHGICGVPLTAVNTVEAITGLNSLVNKLNKLKSDERQRH